MRVTKIYREIKLKQAAWMAPYIQLKFCRVFIQANEQRSKTMENFRRRIWVDLMCGFEIDRMHRFVADPAYLLHKMFDGELAAINSTKSKFKLNRLLYVDLSKQLMYDF